MSRRRLGIWIPIAVGILIETGMAIEVNLASNKMPELYSRNGPLLAGLILLLGVTFLLRLRERRRPGPAREDHVRWRLISRAKNILGEMSSTVLDESGLGQLDLRVSVARPLGPETWKRFGRAADRVVEMKMSALPDYVDQFLDGRALIVGEPGGGKSMLMRTIALRSVERSEGSTAQIPLWLDMEEWPDGTSLESWVLDSLAARKVTGENARELLRNNDLYLFLDGLDQIPTADGQRRAFRATEEFLRRYEMCHLVMTARSDAYAALGAAAERLPLVRISPLSSAEVSAQLWRAGSLAAGLRQAAAQDQELAKALDTPLFLKAGLRAFRGRGTQAILEVRQAEDWDDAILAELVRLVLLEQRTRAVKPEPLLRYLTWVGRVFVMAGVTSFYGFVPPRRLLDEANRHPRMGGFRTAAAVLAAALGTGIAGWLLVGPRTGVATAVLGAVSAYVLTRMTSGQMDLVIYEDRVTWSFRALRPAAPGLLSRLAGAVALAGLAQFAATYEIARIVRLGQMTPAAATRDRLYFAAFLVALLAWCGIRVAVKAGRIAEPADADLPMDTRKTPRAWWLRLPDLTAAFATAGVSAFVALTWATAYQLLASLGPTHLRYASIQGAFRGLLRIMDFPARSPLRLLVGPVWIGVVAAVGFGVGAVFTWAIDLWSEDWSRAVIAACERDAGQSDNDMIDLLDYGVQLSLLRRVEGRYSFYHPRLLEFFSDGRAHSVDTSVELRQPVHSQRNQSTRPIRLAIRQYETVRVLTGDDRCDTDHRAHARPSDNPIGSRHQLV